MDKERAIQFVLSCQSYDYALGQEPGQESHGGSTYCGLAALRLLGGLDRLPHRDELVQWLVERQVCGFQGRLNKDPDTCYSFWVGASLEILGCYHLVNAPLSKSFTLGCQHAIGGFSKTADAYQDVLHTYFSLCGLSLAGEPSLAPIHCALGLTRRAAGGL